MEILKPRSKEIRTPEDIRVEYELTICDLERHVEPWAKLKHRVERSEGLDAAINADFDMSNLRMNHLLEELFTRMGQLAVVGAEDGNQPVAA